MAFPAVDARNTSQEEASNVTSHTVSLPASGHTAGDLILVAFACDGSEAVTWPSEGTVWHELFTASEGTVTLSVAWKKSDGTEDGTTITVEAGSGQGERSGHSSLVISGAADPDILPPEAATAATGSDNAPDPPNISVSATWDYRFVVAIGSDRDKTIIQPSGYANANAVTGGGANSCSCGTFEKPLNTGTDENPPAGGLSAAEGWVANTIKIYPAAAAGAGGIVAPRLRRQVAMLLTQ